MEKTALMILAIAVLMLSSCEQLGLNFGGNATNATEPEDPTRIRLPPITEQWAMEADASSAYGSLHGEGAWTPSAMTGPPDVDACEDDENAWAPAHEDEGEQWIELTYDVPVYFTELRVRETLGPGAIRKIELLNEDGRYVPLFQGNDRNRVCPGYFIYRYNDGDLNKTDFRTDTVRITLDTDTPGWNELDAAELKGYLRKWHVEYEGNISLLIYDDSEEDYLDRYE